MEPFGPESTSSSGTDRTGEAIEPDTSADRVHQATDGDTIVLVAGANDRFALGLTVALSSALRCLDAARRVHVFVLDGGLSAPSRARCRACLTRVRPDAEVTIVEDEPGRFSELHHHGYSRAAYLRLLIPEIVPETYRRILYLDSDVVVDADVAQLWSLPDEGTSFWAAPDQGIPGTGYVRDPVVFADVPDEAPLFNSGVMLIELPHWKRARVSERTLAVLAEHSERCITADQDALNAVAFGNWSELPSRWNFQVRGHKALSTLASDAATPGIVHFLDFKPWNPGVECLHHDLFDAALLASGWQEPAESLRYRARRRMSKAKRWLRSTPVLAPLRAGRRRLRHRSRGKLAQPKG